MNFFTGMTIKSQSIIWQTYPGCEGHQAPCKGCFEYCDVGRDNAVELGVEDLYEAYGEYKCEGRTWYDQTTVWLVTAELKLHDGRFISLQGTGQTIGECLAMIWQNAVDYEAAQAARLIAASSVEGYDDR